MKKYFYTFLFFIVFLIGCSQTPQEMYSGNWELKFSGDLSPKFEFEIRNDLTFSFSKNINVNGESREVFISGEVVEDGTLNSSIFSGGSLVGNISGVIAPETGTGIWEGNGFEGTWIAQKNEE